MDEILNQVCVEIDRARHKVVIVEGKKDARALKNLGFNKVFCLKGPLFELVENISADEVLVLTDLDKEGRFLFSRLSRDLSAHGVQVDNRLREALFRTDLRQIEGLETYLRGFLIRTGCDRLELWKR